MKHTGIVPYTIEELQLEEKRTHGKISQYEYRGE